MQFDPFASDDMQMNNQRPKSNSDEWQNKKETPNNDGLDRGWTQKKKSGKWKIIAFLIPFFNRKVICLKFTRHTHEEKEKCRKLKDNFFNYYSHFIRKETQSVGGYAGFNFASSPHQSRRLIG